MKALQSNPITPAPSGGLEALGLRGDDASLRVRGPSTPVVPEQAMPPSALGAGLVHTAAQESGALRGPSDLLKLQVGQLDVPAGPRVGRRGRTSELRVKGPDELKRTLEGAGRPAYRALAELGPEFRQILEAHGLRDD